MAVNVKKGMRKIIINDRLFFWYVRKNQEGIPRLHIISEDKKIIIDKPLFDTEISVTRDYVIKLICEYFNNKQLN